MACFQAVESLVAIGKTMPGVWCQSVFWSLHCYDPLLFW
jgi:hypothetical protein